MVVRGNTVGAIATYTCNPGFELIGQEERVCQSDGSYSGQAPICRSMWLWVFFYLPPILSHYYWFSFPYRLLPFLFHLYLLSFSSFFIVYLPPIPYYYYLSLFPYRLLPFLFHLYLLLSLHYLSSTSHFSLSLPPVSQSYFLFHI